MDGVFCTLLAPGMLRAGSLRQGSLQTLDQGQASEDTGSSSVGLAIRRVSGENSWLVYLYPAVQEVFMFEYDQEIVQILLKENLVFKTMHDKHGAFKRQVTDAEHGIHPMDDFALERLKKEKLLLKDKMADMIEAYRKGR
jgi:uncharacterized protein YdcH (DUF465 family)